MGKIKVTDLDVCMAYLVAKAKRAKEPSTTPMSVLMKDKEAEIAADIDDAALVCQKAIERACNRGLITFNNRREFGWLTEPGEELLRSAGEIEEVDRSESLSDDAAQP